ncbi:MAG: hypothetical protein R3344_06465 [Acidobacteriota bacterium]|nr:hypothetical protein [Acidobacteriota bacterium]
MSVMTETPPPPDPPDPPPDPGGLPPPIDEPDPIEIGDDPLRMMSDKHAKLVRSGWWAGWWTGTPRKLGVDEWGRGTNEEKNATIAYLAHLTRDVIEDARAYEEKGRLITQITINLEGLEVGGGGKHLLNLASDPLSRGRRDGSIPNRVTRVEIANPGDNQDRFVLHNYVDGRGGARDLGDLPLLFRPGRPEVVDLTWEIANDKIKLTLKGDDGSDHVVERELLPGSPGIVFCGPGHVETISGGGVFAFDRFRVLEA